MADKHEICRRNECERDFAEIRGEVKNQGKNHEVTSKALATLARVVEINATERRSEHGETVRIFSGYQSQVLKMATDQSERTALTEASAKSAHHRLDTQHRMLLAVIVAFITLALGAVLKLVTGFG